MPKFNHPDDFIGTFWTVFDADFYVSTIGNDFSGDGSPKKPFLTVHKAFELSTNGEKIIIGPDEYLRVDLVTTSKNVGAELPCRFATTENIDLTIGGLLSPDGTLPTEAEDRVLVWSQTNPAENGIYVASANAWERADDFINPENIVPGKLVPVLEGDQNSQTVFQYVTTIEEVVVGTTHLLFTQAAVSDWGQIQGDILNQADLTTKIADDITVAIDNLKEGVPVDGDTLNKLYDLIQNIVGVSASATNIGDRDTQKSGLEDQQNIYVTDASADTTVNAGWAIYKYLQPSDSFVKIAEQENLDVVLFTNGNGTTINGNKIDLGGNITSDIIFTDARDAGLQKGLEYAGDYSFGFDVRSLVDRGYVDTSLNAHTSATDNPHSVTKAQVGLSNVDDTADTNKPVSIAQQEAIDLALGTAGSFNISPIEGYDNVFYVNAITGNDTTGAPNSADYYQTINAASDAARADYDVNQKKNIVYVQRETYNEKSVVRNNVDMFFEDGAVVWTIGSGNSVINDIAEVMNNVRIYGKGTFISRDTTPYDDREGINLRRPSKMYIEAKLVDNIQIWNNDEAEFEFRGMDIIFRLAVHHNKKLLFTECKFLNGMRISSYRGNNTLIELKNCDFILPPYSVLNSLNTTPNIYDKDGNLLFRIIRANPVNTAGPMDFTGKNNDQIIAETFATYTSSADVTDPKSACLMYSQNLAHNIGSLKVEIRNSRCIIQKESANGIILCKRRNSSSSEGYVLFDDVIIIDETVNKDTTALVTGWGDVATVQPGLMLNAVSANCGTLEKLIHPTMNPWLSTFDKVEARNQSETQLHDLFFDASNLQPQYTSFRSMSAVNIIAESGIAITSIERWSGTSFETAVTTIEDVNADLLTLPADTLHRYRFTAQMNSGITLGRIMVEEVFRIKKPISTFLKLPQTSNLASTSIDVNAQLSENGTIYIKIIADSEPAPDAATIVAEDQFSAVDTGAGATISITGLTASTAYDIYTAAQDTLGNIIGSFTKLNIVTIA